MGADVKYIKKYNRDLLASTLKEAVFILNKNEHGCPVRKMEDGTFLYLTNKHKKAIREVIKWLKEMQLSD